MSRVEAGSTYNSLTDHHLTNYFSRPRPRQHLRQSGLIRSDGEIISDTSIFADGLKKDQKQREKEAILRSLESRKEDLTRNHQALCLRTIEEIQKIERVRRIRSGKRNGFGDSYTELIDCAIVPPSICHRPLKASFMNGTTCPLMSSCHSNSSLLQSRRARSAGVCRGGGCCREEDESQCNGHLNARRASGDRANGLAPYLQAQMPSEYLPVLPKRKSRRRTGLKRKLRASGRHERKTGQPLKPRLTNTEEDDWRLAMVTMKYYGDNLRLDNDQADPRVDVLVEQQHCGGNTLYVFRDKILPGTEFTFPSYRHPGYPFSLTIYVNGRHDSRLSVCCEYKHRINARLGGKGGHFAVVGVKRGMPCHRCMIRYRKSDRKKKYDTKDWSKDSDDSDSRGDNDEETAMSRVFPGHRNRLRIPVDDEENDRDEEYGRELNRRTADAQSPELERKGRTSSAKKSRDPYDHFLYDIKVAVEDEDNGNNNNASGVVGTRRDSASREQQMKSPPHALQREETSSESSSSESEEDEEEGEEKEEQDADSTGSESSEDIENVKPKSSRSQRESNRDDEPASESGS